MRNLLIISAVITTFCIQPVFATVISGTKTCFTAHPNFKACIACSPLAETCAKAGYWMEGAPEAKPGKMMWFDCMRPLLLNKRVTGVTVVNPSVVKTCRTQKINELQKELTSLQKANKH